MKVSKLDGLFGVAVDDIDLSQDISDSTARSLIDLLYQNQILVIRQQALSGADYVRFGRKWGRPLSFMLPDQTRNDHPEIIRVSNSLAVPERYRDGARNWHSDSSYEEVPASVTMLYGVEVPRVGGETLIASARFAYDALDDEMKQRIEPMSAFHCIAGSPELPGERNKVDIEQIAKQGLHLHPLVMRHPVTGTKAIYTSATAVRIDGMGLEESQALIYKLRTHITRPEFRTSYKIQVGDVFVWDNFQVMHSATPIQYTDEEGCRRMLHRISTKGVPDLCTPGAVAA